jgi:hypothetical protein
MLKSATNNKFRLPKNASSKASNVRFTVQSRNINLVAHKPIVKSGIHLFFTLAFAGFIGLLSLSCENGMEEPVVTASTFPMESGGIIYGDWTPIRVGFSETMVETDAAYLAGVVKVWDHNFIPVSGAAAWEDNTIYFSPLAKWKSGEKYTCRIHGTFSTYDGRVVGVQNELLFYAVTDKETAPRPPPEIAEVFFLKKTETGSYEETEYDADEYWNNVIRGECGLKILFTEEMDLSEPRRSLRMEPYRNYEVRVIDNQTLEVYFEAEYKPVKKITLTVKEDTHSFTGEELQQDYDFAFTEWENDLHVKIMALSSDEYYGLDSELPSTEWYRPFRVGTELYKGERWLDFTYWFDQPMELVSTMVSLTKITLIPADERIEAIPSLQSVELYPPDYDQSWGGIEFGPMEDPYRYMLNIPGGIDGISDAYGHYLKEDITIKLDVVDWDLIDPLNQ